MLVRFSELGASAATAEDHGEAVAKAIAKERVEDWVDGAVSVVDDGIQLVDQHDPLRQFTVGEEEKHLEDPVGQPADKVDSDDRCYHDGHSRLD